MTIQDMSSRPECANGQTVLGRKGCGKVDTVNNALGGSEFTFDAQTGTLLGVYDYDDVPGGVCNVWVYSYGGPRLSHGLRRHRVLCGVRPEFGSPLLDRG